MAESYGFNLPYAGGISQLGGSAANLSSISIARNNLFPDVKTGGYGGKQFVLFTSAHGHYSIEETAQICGFGSKAVITIAVDERGCMQPEALDAAIEKAKQDGKTPFYVNATASTTVLDAFDPLPEIADICQKHGSWMHVDVSWGGPVIFSDKHKHKVAGISRAYTVSLYPHKMMGIPLTCTDVLLG